MLVYYHGSMKRNSTYAQHFLRSPRLVHELIGHSDIKRTDIVFDLGAGSGVITSALAARASRVVAVENEPNAVQKLQENMRIYDNVTVLKKDILAVEFPDHSFKVFANIPFHLSSEVVRTLTSLVHQPASIYLVVQRQFARKLLPTHAGFSSQLGMLIGPWWTVRIRRPLLRRDFTPPPAVDTVLLEIKPHPHPLILPAKRSRYERFVKRAFTDLRFYEKYLKKSCKPSSLTLDEWVRAFKMFND